MRSCLEAVEISQSVLRFFRVNMRIAKGAVVTRWARAIFAGKVGYKLP